MAKALKLFGLNTISAQQLAVFLPVWLWLCLLLGGASQGGVLPNLLLQLGAASLIALWIWRGSVLQLQREERFPVYLLVAALVWIGIMFVPLPPALWQLLPGRDFVAEGYRLLGIELPWLSMALTPERAVRSLLALLAPVAAWLIVRRLDEREKRRLLASFMAMAVISAALGLMQMSTGPASVLRFYSPTNTDAPVGFFANTNHLSVFLACTLPLAAAWVATAKPAKLPKRGILIGLGIFAAFIAVTLIVGRSLSGLAFLILAAIGAAHIIWGRFVSGRAKTAIIAGAAVALLVAVSALGAIGSGAIGAKFEDVPNSRATLTPVTIAAGNEMAPTGSGLGSFVQVYAMHQPDRYTSTTWVNHAHNDYAEIWLELGVSGIILVLAFLGWFVRQGYGLWHRRNDPETLIAQAAWMAGALLLSHSMVDYPLRTAALAAFFAAMLALICGTPKQPQTERG
jgi:O-antigen ligase